ncbi:MAG: hypothetical protein KDD67_06720 [Ignavibacteriae bacterium]|nr:hypothetical protein [Ignavibacteriota bacterium]MCB9215630.1 hypothetical protein [Ignavibacteria bacterium]
MHRKIILIFYSLISLSIALPLILINVRLHQDAIIPIPVDADEHHEIVRHLDWLRKEMREGSAEEMQRRYPEGFVFLHALYGLAWCNVAAKVHDSTLKQKGLAEARWAYQRIDSKEGRHPFQRISTPPCGMFYAGWANYLLGSIIAARMERSIEEDSLFARNSEQLAFAFRTSETPFLQSYPGKAWPADAVVGVASLALYNKLFSPRYQSEVDRWVRMTRQRFDQATNLIPHAVDPTNGMPSVGARGSSLSLMLCFLPGIDSLLAREQYREFRAKFCMKILGLPAIREYPNGREGVGDIDSGPLFFGMGPAATIVAVGGMNVAGENRAATEQLCVINAFGFLFSFGGEPKYLFGIEPIADAFILWTSTLLTSEANVNVIESTPPFSRMTFHAISLGILLLLSFPYSLPFLRRRFRKRAEEK